MGRPLARGIVEQIKKNVKDPKWMDVFMTYEEEIKIARDSALMEGEEKSFKNGTDATIARMAKLSSALAAVGRSDELTPALSNREMLDALFAEFHINLQMCP